MVRSNNIFISTVRYIAVEVILDILYFPVWWYSKGLTRVGRYCLESAAFHVNRRVGLGIWVRSMFKPMYGDFTWEGRIISGFMRIFVLLWKLVSTVLWFALLVVTFLLWVLLPVAAVYLCLYQVFGVSIPLKP
ncbi:MAG: hypothetical protein V1916_02915 [Patescibacteria group bacterium]